MLQSYKKIKYQHTKNQKKQEMEMPDNKQVSNLLKKKNVENGLMLSNLRKLLLRYKVRSGFQ